MVSVYVWIQTLTAAVKNRFSFNFDRFIKCKMCINAHVYGVNSDGISLDTD